MGKKKVLVLGASGLVGSHFIKKYTNNLIVLAPTHEELDITDLINIKSYFSHHPDITHVLNFAAYTNISEAQKQKNDPDSPCWLVNVKAVKNLVRILENRDTFFIQISTNAVFSGNNNDKGPYAENHILTPNPEYLSFYGYSKAIAEQILTKAFRGKLAIIRLICPVVKKYNNKTDFLRKPLEFYRKYKYLYPIFTDQQINITDTDEFCEIIKVIIDKNNAGIFHGGSSDITTPYQMIVQLFDLVHGRHDMVIRGSINGSKKYLKYDGLLNKATEKFLGLHYSSSSAIINRLYG